MARGMMRFAGLWSPLRSDSRTIGPGRLVVVVGPSGAGKDTLLSVALARCHDDRDVVFPRRVVTRPSSGAEAHDTLSESVFDDSVSRNAFAFWWKAHGLKYAIPIAIDTDIRAGRTVVCNVSRTVVGSLRERYARVSVVLVTAPAEVLAGRLASRERASDGVIEERIRRAELTLDAELRPDVTIENVATAEIGGKRLLDAIYDRHFSFAL
jgi:ribose 1,5-bisphosphokinase